MIQVEKNVSSPIQGRANTITQDFETFLKMLTTQIQNQDPLSPMAADQFASQLASFSMVEQQTLTNQRLEQLVLGLGSDGRSSFASFMGRHILHEGPFNFSGSAVLLEIDGVSVDESGLKLSIVSRDGRVVSEKSFSEGQSQMHWNGTDKDGLLVEPGFYSAEIRRVSDDTPVNAKVVTAGLVEEVRFGSGGAEFILANGTIVTENNIAGVRLLD
ncbi:flagellar hook capping FlgD N-terminal domain-containing protein [Marivita sp. XM-24bin2]|uniref:flagellar hook capping FlgD N-terminal domain-containing protein n=1 Tax=unclassified Marivita TaxID=2632480 RepID=UPI0025BD45DC|nr:flagellar hook capping FlgD N-terminal domain-containing protein [Marivita sp. XM-24bin2]MCR9109666.1 hypothetical protein [Paracoccaceae bacterium]